MRATGPSVVIIQHLKSLGIKLRMPKKTVSPDVQRKSSNGGLFGVPLQSLPPSTEREVPQLVVDICQFLSSHLSTEGLFRKSGSVNRIKTLKAQLESGNGCLSSAHPSDVAALLKQFFRELPQPLLAAELQDPLCQIQQSLNEEERGPATTLVSCLLPAVHGETLKYFCTFLQSVASRSEENKMDTGNLAVVLAPSLFSSSYLGEKLTLATEKQLQLQASAIQTLIQHAQDIAGQLPSIILEKISLPCDAGEEDSVGQNLEGLRRRRRRSMSGIVNGAFNKLKSGLGPSNFVTDKLSDELELPLRSKTKRKASEDSGCGEFCTPKKRRSLHETVDGTVFSEERREPIGSDSPLLDDAGGGEVFSDFCLTPEDLLEGQVESSAAPPTPESSSRGQKGRAKRRNSKRTKKMQAGQIPTSPAHLERKEKVRNSLRLFQRARTTKQQTPECKNLEQSGWTLMKKMVADALEGRDFRVPPFILKTSNSVDVPGGKNSSAQDHHSLRSSPSWKSLVPDSENLDTACSSKQRRSLRRSLSMPEKVGDGIQAEGDQEAVSNSLTIKKESRSHEDGLNFSEKTYVLGNDRHSGKDCLYASKSHTMHSYTSVTELGAQQHVPPLRHIGHTSQYRSVRKLVLSLPWTNSISDMDPQVKDWEALSSHPIKRKGARRYGRSISQESGMQANGDQRLFKRTDDDGESTNSSLLGGRNRPVFISRKNITLSQYGYRSLDLPCQESLEDHQAGSESPSSDTSVSLDKEGLPFKEMRVGVEEYKGSHECLIPGSEQRAEKNI
ncbi:rho GTPase-activating protein 11A-like isoform X2 [Hyperolius riggenbachi]|uniref:rho GTPase-activating protein 11A-like isoform X2 n=1 Tax=Hyperolius riggenbachi TaxID=752182 RepID=UPI0035A328F8